MTEPAELTPEEQEQAAAELRKTYKRPAADLDAEGLHRLGGGLVVYVSRHDRGVTPLLSVKDGAYGLEEEPEDVTEGG